jgi:hypothetical protein
VRPSLLLASLITVTGCASEASTPDISPDVLTAAPPPPPALSQFNVPVEYNFGSVLSAVERAIPLQFGSLDSIRTVENDSRRHYAFEAHRQAFTAYADGRVIRLKATLAYAAKGYYKPIVTPTISAGCGGKDIATRPRITVELSTPITLTAEWHLASRIQLDSIGPASDEQRDRCDVSILRRDITDRVVETARRAIEEHLPEIDAKVNEVNLDGRFRYWWSLLGHPIRLSDGVWLTIAPDLLSIGEVTGRGHVLTVPVTLRARPRIVMSPTVPALQPLALPPLAHGGSRNGFRIFIDGAMDYATASRLLADAIVNRRISEGGRTVTVSAVRVTPTRAGRLSLAGDFAGDARGTLMFVGRPVIDSARREITVPDLDYDLATDNKLLASYSWLRSERMRLAFRARAHFQIDSTLARAKSLLLSGLNRSIGGVLTLSSTVDSVAVRGLYVTRDGLVVRAEARGKSRVRARQ